MIYHDKEQAQLECDLLNRKGGDQYAPKQGDRDVARYGATRPDIQPMWFPVVSRDLTDQHVRRTMHHT